MPTNKHFIVFVFNVCLCESCLCNLLINNVYEVLRQARQFADLWLKMEQCKSEMHRQLCQRCFRAENLAVKNYLNWAKWKHIILNVQKEQVPWRAIENQGGGAKKMN